MKCKICNKIMKSDIDNECYICECGFKVKSCFKTRICDKCNKDMKLEEKQID